MDSSKIFGGSEECHSSESGWTMYICSPIHGDDDDDDDDDNSYHHGYGDDHNDDGDDKDGSDDSMASDASSHPRHVDGVGIHREVRDNGKKCSNKKGKKPVEKKCDEKKKKNEVNVKGEIFPVQSGNKVRKNFWIGKRK